MFGTNCQLIQSEYLSLYFFELPIVGAKIHLNGKIESKKNMENCQRHISFIVKVVAFLLVKTCLPFRFFSLFPPPLFYSIIVCVFIWDYCHYFGVLSILFTKHVFNMWCIWDKLRYTIPLKWIHSSLNKFW